MTATFPVTLHEGHDGGPGIAAWALDVLGFSTWAPSRDDVLAKLPGKLAEFGAILERHGIAFAPPEGAPRVEEEVRGDEVLFARDREPATPAEIDRTLERLAATRADLLAVLDGADDALLDWDPLYENFAPWASWRTIRANLAHVADGETQYYLHSIGHVSGPHADPSREGWRDFLDRTRAEATAFLQELRGADDLLRQASIDHGWSTEEWTVRKSLRRMVSHEITHTKSIRRIVGEYRAVGT